MTHSPSIRFALGCALAAAATLASAQAGPSNPLTQGTPGVPTDRGLFRSDKSPPDSDAGITLYRSDEAASTPGRKPDARLAKPRVNGRPRTISPVAKQPPRGAAASAAAR